MSLSGVARDVAQDAALDVARDVGYNPTDIVSLHVNNHEHVTPTNSHQQGVSKYMTYHAYLCTNMTFGKAGFSG